MRLKDEHVFITGGAKGIGEAVVDKCMAEGARVTVIDFDAAAGRKLVERSDGARLCFGSGDVRRAEDIARVHAEGAAKFGVVTGLVNNAGRNSYANPVTMTEAEWDDVFSVDLKSAWLCARAVLPGMIDARKGSIVNIASIHADLTYPGMFPYAAAKSGLVGMTRSLALEVGPQQVRVNAVSPGYTLTQLVEEFFASRPAELREQVIANHPMGRMAEPSEVANCIAFLLSSEASFVTGANWRVDGGLGARFA